MISITSSRASSVTLADESTQDESVPMDIVSDDGGETSFDLPDEYFEPLNLNNLSPSMRAAREPDPRYLRAVLDIGVDEDLGRELDNCSRDTGILRCEDGISGNFSPPGDWDSILTIPKGPSEFGPNAVRFSGGNGDPKAVGITSPLMEAIRAGLSDNVSILLNAGADPNGFPIDVFEKYSALFLRFRPAIPSLVSWVGDVASRERLLGCMDLSQLSILTREEVEDRFYEGVAPFWSEEGFVRANVYPHGESSHSLVEAARSGSIEIFDQIFVAGADRSFWIKPQFYRSGDPTPSSLSVSCPLHAALEIRDNKMLQHLLNIGFNPNTMPLANPTRCFTPLMATIIHNACFNITAFDILASHPSIDFELRTPVYDVHILHFAVATLNLDLLEHVSASTPLHNAGDTALGHTLLHIACMPANALQIQRHSELIHKSIHETRDLHAHNDPHSRHPERPSRFPINPEFEYLEMKQQTAMVKYLWDSGVQDIEKQDVHGNTALHYLAGCKVVNLELINWLNEKESAGRVWQECNNWYESSPVELANHGSRAKGCKGWRPWFESSWSVGRRERKERIWERLLRRDVDVMSGVA